MRASPCLMLSRKSILLVGTLLITCARTCWSADTPSAQVLKKRLSGISRRNSATLRLTLKRSYTLQLNLPLWRRTTSCLMDKLLLLETRGMLFPVSYILSRLRLGEGSAQQRLCSSLLSLVLKALAFMRQCKMIFLLLGVSADGSHFQLQLYLQMRP